MRVNKYSAIQDVVIILTIKYIVLASIFCQSGMPSITINCPVIRSTTDVSAVENRQAIYSLLVFGIYCKLILLSKKNIHRTITNPSAK